MRSVLDIEWTQQEWVAAINWVEDSPNPAYQLLMGLPYEFWADAGTDWEGQELFALEEV